MDKKTAANNSATLGWKLYGSLNTSVAQKYLTGKCLTYKTSADAKPELVKKP